MATTKVDELKKSIAGFERVIDDPASSDAIKKAMKAAKAKAMEALQAEEAKEAPKPKKEKKAPKSEPKKAAAKKDEEEEEELITITVMKDGKPVKETFNINNCEQAIKAAHARKERDRQSGAKTKSKSPGQRAKDRIVLATEAITELVPEKLLKEDPQKVVGAFQQFEKDSAKALFNLCKSLGVSKSLTDKLEKAYEEVIDPIIAEIKDEILAGKK
jgi:hypothetical protein